MTNAEWLKWMDSRHISDWTAEEMARYNELTGQVQAAKARKNAARRARHEAYTSLGMKRVRGALGGVYYE